MTVQELIDELTKICTVHEEARDAEVWASKLVQFGIRSVFHVRNVGFDKRHHPARMKLED